MTCDLLETWPESLVCLLTNWKYGNCCMMYSTAAPTLLFPRGCSISQKYNKRQSLFEAWRPVWKRMTSCVLPRAIFQTRTQGFVSTARTQITNGGEIPLHMSAHAQAQSMECILIALLVLRAPNNVRFLLESSYQPWRTPTFHENASVSLRSATGTMSMRGDWWPWKKRLKVPLQSEMFFFLFLRLSVPAPTAQNDACAEFGAQRLFSHSRLKGSPLAENLTEGGGHTRAIYEIVWNPVRV